MPLQAANHNTHFYNEFEIRNVVRNDNELLAEESLTYYSNQ